MRGLSNSWLSDYRTKSKYVMAARVTKRNINKALRLVEGHMSVVRESVETQDQTADQQAEIRFRHWFDKEDNITTVTIGSYIITEHGRITVLSPREFSQRFDPIHRMPSFYTPTKDEVQILKKLRPDDEYYSSYDSICDMTGFTRERAKKAIDNLRSMGVVDYQKGLMNDDGEVAGSGFALGDPVRAEALLYRYYGDGRISL